MGEAVGEAVSVSVLVGMPLKHRASSARHAVTTGGCQGQIEAIHSEPHSASSPALERPQSTDGLEFTDSVRLRFFRLFPENQLSLGAKKSPASLTQ